MRKDVNSKRKIVIFVLLSFLMLTISYVEISYLMYTRIVFPLVRPAMEKWDVMDETEIETQKVTGKDWWWWTKDSYIDYRWETKGEFLSLYYVSGTEVMQSKIFWGIDGIYQDNAEAVETVSSAYNFIRIPDERYNCARIYLCNPIEMYEENNEESDSEMSYIRFQEICLTNGCLDWVRLYGGTLIVWGVSSFFIWAFQYGEKSRYRDVNYRYRKFTAFIVIWGLFLFLKCYLKYNGIVYFGDAGFYYNASEMFLSEGGFSFRNYLVGSEMWIIRGYFLPFLFLLFKLPGKIIDWIGPDVSWNICATAFCAMFFAYGGEYGFKKITGKNLDFVRILAAPCLFCAFARGLIAYPLSDLYSVVFALVAIYFVQDAIEKKKLSIRIVWAVLAGGSIYAAYNIRSSQILFCILALIIVIYQGKRKAIPVLIGMSVGILALGIPQCIINENILGVKSIAVQNQNFGPGESLTAAQLKNGILMYRYECDLSAGSSGATGWINREVYESSLLMEERNEVKSISKYIIFIAKHPRVMLKNVIVHLCMAMDMRFPDIINKRIDMINPLQDIYIIFFWFSFIMIFLRKKRDIFQKKHTIAIAWVLVLMIPGFAQIMGGFESRFAVAIYLLCFMFVAYTFSLQESRALSRKQLFTRSIMTVLMICIIMRICGAVYTL